MRKRWYLRQNLKDEQTWHLQGWEEVKDVKLRTDGKGRCVMTTWLKPGYKANSSGRQT